MKSDELVTKEGEFEKILSLAEELQKNCDRYSILISMLRIGAILIVFLFSAFLLLSFRDDVFNIHDFYDVFFGLVSTLIILTLFVYAIEYIMVRDYTRKRRRDSRALYEIIEMLRELGEFQGNNEGWSELDKAQYRIRLSRFGIGDDYSDFPHRNFMRKSEGYKYNKEA